MSTHRPSEPVAAIRHRVLVVEDNDAASQGLARILEARGFEVTVRRNGKSALEALTSDPPPEFILTDLQLPDLDGREIALHARGLTPPPRVALITGWILDANRSDLESWGVDWIFSKPIDTSSLLARLREPHDWSPDGRDRPH